MCCIFLDSHINEMRCMGSLVPRPHPPANVHVRELRVWQSASIFQQSLIVGLDHWTGLVCALQIDDKVMCSFMLILMNVHDSFLLCVCIHACLVTVYVYICWGPIYNSDRFKAVRTALKRAGPIWYATFTRPALKPTNAQSCSLLDRYAKLKSALSWGDLPDPPCLDRQSNLL